MSVVFDADIISTFAKIGKIHLLKKVFKEELSFPDAVQDDLIRARDAGYDYVTTALKEFKFVGLQQEEADFVKSQSGKILGLGELECIAICKFRNYTFATNDKQAKVEAKKQGVNVVDLGGILWQLKPHVSKEELKQIVQYIEEKDHTLLKGKELLLKD